MTKEWFWDKSLCLSLSSVENQIGLAAVSALCLIHTTCLSPVFLFADSFGSSPIKAPDQRQIGIGIGEQEAHQCTADAAQIFSMQNIWTYQGPIREL